MKISEILNENIISIDLKPADKTEAINMMVDLANNSGKIIDLEKVRACIFDREKIVSTGVGKGFAVPHGKTDEITDVVAAFGITKSGIDFDSIDSEPVNFIFLLVGKDSLLNAHIKLLSRISRLMNKEDFRDKLLLATSPKEILNLFKEEEQNLIDI